MSTGLSHARCHLKGLGACPCMQTLVMALQRHDGGRITVFGDELRIHSQDGTVEQSKIETLEDFKHALTLFGIPVETL